MCTNRRLGAIAESSGRLRSSKKPSRSSEEVRYVPVIVTSKSGRPSRAAIAEAVKVASQRGSSGRFGLVGKSGKQSEQRTGRYFSAPPSSSRRRGRGAIAATVGGDRKGQARRNATDSVRRRGGKQAGPRGARKGKQTAETLDAQLDAYMGDDVKKQRYLLFPRPS